MNIASHHIGQAQEKEPSNNILYLILSFLSGVLETGVLTAGLMRFDISMGLAFALSYQTGCLVRNPLRLSLKGAACILCCSLPLLMLGNGRVWVLLLMTALVSAGIQSSREWLLPKQPAVSLSVKRIVRVSGFIGGILVGFWIGMRLIDCIAILACVAVIPMSIRKVPKHSWINLNKRFESDKYGWIMLCHQTHYFAYAYVLLAILLPHKILLSNDTVFFKVTSASGWFALGWLSYISGQWLLKEKLKMSSFQAAIAGHTWAAASLFCMALFHNCEFALGIAWVLGGFGGGSVYAIKDLAKVNASRADIDLWEHWGHVVGVSLSLFSILVFPSLVILPFVIAFVAVLATLFMLIRSNGWQLLNEKCTGAPDI